MQNVARSLGAISSMGLGCGRLGPCVAREPGGSQPGLYIAFHTRTVRSTPAEAMRLPSGDQAKAVT